MQAVRLRRRMSARTVPGAAAVQTMAENIHKEEMEDDATMMAVELPAPGFQTEGRDGCGCFRQNQGVQFHQEGSAVGRDTLAGGRGRPKRPPSMENLPENTLAQDMAQLSVQERNTVFEEIHGVDGVVEEGPEFVEDKLARMKEEIQKIVHREAYNKAVLLSPTRVHSKQFCLMFLRSTKFDAKAAAAKVVTHFDFKSKLFGAEKVAKEITMDDFSEDDMITMRAGASMPLGKDSAGRGILFTSVQHIQAKTYDNQLRVSWYNCMNLLQDEEVQKKGIVILAYEVGTVLREAKFRKERMASIPMYQDALPMRITSLHYCYSDSSVRPIITLFLQLAPKRLRVRMRDHFGGHLECQYALMSYGISAQMLNVDQDGNIKKSMVADYIARHSTRDSQSIDASTACGDFSTIEMATDKDVLLGRGKPYQNHPGNVQLKKLIDARREEFNGAPKFQKTVISWEILKMMQKEYNARFLERDEATGRWKECEDEAARIKVAYGFRSRPKAQQAKAPPPPNLMAQTFMSLTNWGFAQDTQQPSRKSPHEFDESMDDNVAKRHRGGY